MDFDRIRNDTKECWRNCSLLQDSAWRCYVEAYRRLIPWIVLGFDWCLSGDQMLRRASKDLACERKDDEGGGMKQ